MNNWDKKVIGKAISFNPSESLERGTIAPKIPMGNLTEHERKIDGFELAKYKSGPKFRNGDTLLAKITPCLENGKTAQVDILEKDQLAFGSSEFIVMRATKHTIPDYVYYLSISPTFRKKAISCMEGTSGRKRVRHTTLKKFELPFPSIEEQERITGILKAIDSKIERNKKINNELESMAKLIYDYWFVQFDFPNENGKPYKSSGGDMVFNKKLKREIPRNWKVGGFEDLGDIVGGSTPSKSDKENFSKNGTPWITPKDLSDNSEKKFFSKGEWDVTKKGIKDASLNLLPKGTVLLSSRAPIGYLAIARNDVTTNQGFKSIVPFDSYPTEYVYYTVKTFIPAMVQYASGSTFKEISATILKMIKIHQPPEELIEKFSNKVKPLFDKQDLLEKESKELEKLRDWLLPMLMNGQITVKEAEEELSIAAESDTNYKVTKKPTNVDFYRRTVLAAEIVWQLHQQPTLGHVKLQKIIYLAKQTSSMMLPTNFLKQAAGPYDPKMARSIDKQLKKNKWFEFQRDEYLKYKPLEKAGEHRADFSKYFQEEKENIQFLINTFKKAKTAKVEIIATLYACWKEIIDKGQTVTDDILIEQFYNWSEEKAKFKQDRLLKAINWMREEGVCPVP